MARLHDWRVFEGMSGKRMRGRTPKRNARSTAAASVIGSVLPPGWVIPCRVAPLQSPTPFHPAPASLVHAACWSKKFAVALSDENRHKRLPALSIENRHKRLPALHCKCELAKAGQFRIVVIIVTHTDPETRTCRF